MTRRRPRGFYLAASGAVLSGLAALYCGLGYVMTGSFAVARGATAEEVRGPALSWGISALALAVLFVFLVFVGVRLAKQPTDD